MAVTPGSNVIGVFRDRSLADQAIEAFYNAGYTPDNIRYSAPDTNSGSFIEGLKSFFTGTSSNVENIANDLSAMDLPQDDVQYYTSEYNNGNLILAVNAPGREQETSTILHQSGAYNTRLIGYPAMDDTEPTEHIPTYTPTDTTTEESYTTTDTVNETPFTSPEITSPQEDVQDTVNSETAHPEYPEYNEETEETVQQNAIDEHQPGEISLAEYDADQPDNATPVEASNDQQEPAYTTATATEDTYTATDQANPYIEDQPTHAGAEEQNATPVEDTTEPAATADGAETDIDTATTVEENSEAATPTSDPYATEPETTTSTDDEYDTQPETAAVANNEYTTEPEIATPASNEPEAAAESTEVSDPEAVSEPEAATEPEAVAESAEVFEPETATEPEATAEPEAIAEPEQTVAQPSSASESTPDYADRLRQLQEQLQTTRQHLEEAKQRLQDAKDHETQIQSVRQELQQLQEELQATQAELQATYQRITQY